MRKVPSLFKRDYDGTRMVYDEVVSGCEWVLRGEGRATRKHDGTACMVKDSVLFRRYDAKRGKAAPTNFTPAQDKPDEMTGHWPGWVPCDRSDPGSKYHFDAFDDQASWEDGTYELCGPKVQGNPEGSDNHVLVRHGSIELTDSPRDFQGLRLYIQEQPIEGIVWHHPDGRMSKLKKKDFGFRR